MNHSDLIPASPAVRGDPADLAILSHIRDIAPPGDLIEFVAAARSDGEPAFYWESPSREFAVAATGSAWQASASGRARFATAAAAVKRLRAIVAVNSDSDWIRSPILTAGFAFADDIADGDAWRGFEPARVALPSTCVVRRGDRAALIRNVAIRADTRIAELARSLAAGQPPRWIGAGKSAVPPPILARHAHPDPAAWMSAVADTVDEIRRGHLAKLVLARSCHLRGTAEFDLARVLRHLSAHETGCTVFAISGGDADFVGATPETLATLDAGEMRTTALAGTTPRGATADRDYQLRRALARSGKDRAEHDLVVRGIRDALGPIVASLDADGPPDVVALQRVQHLRTSLRGRVKPPCGILDLIAALHPSPAVGGYPRQGAIARIARRESFERGWYAGPVGWMNLDGDGEFAVGLRSGVVRGRDAWVFAGAGIVGDSDPRAELMETDLKLRPMLAALTGCE